MKSIAFRFAIGLFAAAAYCPAAILFFDDFDSSLPATTLNADVPGWTTTAGTVDYIKSGGFGIACVGGTGGCIDLDGSTFDAATPFETATSFPIVAGRFYKLSFRLSGNQRGGASDTVTYEFGDLSGSVGPLASADPYTLYSDTFFATADSSSTIRFANAGGDNFGAILDDVTLEETIKGGGVPEPSSFALLGLGIVALVARKFRR
jgi:hypothetical protein